MENGTEYNKQGSSGSPLIVRLSDLMQKLEEQSAELAATRQCLAGLMTLQDYDCQTIGDLKQRIDLIEQRFLGQRVPMN